MHRLGNSFDLMYLSHLCLSHHMTRSPMPVLHPQTLIQILPQAKHRRNECRQSRKPNVKVTSNLMKRNLAATARHCTLSWTGLDLRNPRKHPLYPQPVDASLQPLFFTNIMIDMSFAAAHAMCTHPGCRKGWKAIGALSWASHVRGKKYEGAQPVLSSIYHSVLKLLQQPYNVTVWFSCSVLFFFADPIDWTLLPNPARGGCWYPIQLASPNNCCDELRILFIV